MARPTNTKDAKPKVEESTEKPAGGAQAGGSGLFDLKFILLVVVVVVTSLLSTAGAGYLMTTLFIIPELSKIAYTGGSGGEAHEEEHHGHDAASTEVPHNQVGMNLELNEFTVNLKEDRNMEGHQFLRAKVALSIKVPEEENCYAAHDGDHHAMLNPSLPEKNRPYLTFTIKPAGSGSIVGAAAPLTKQIVSDQRLLASGGGDAGPSCEDMFKNNMAKYVPTIRDIINVSLMKRTASSLASIEGQEALKDELSAQVGHVMAPTYSVIRVNFQDFIIQK
ncbi:MAG: flagellar basal body-associated FliL family protein [Cyanobacteria bacterium P01_H01_bin.74]